MGSERRRQDAVLAEVYAQVPVMLDCKGLCHDSCGPIPASRREVQRVHIASGIDLPAAEKALAALNANDRWRCPVLGEDNLCRAYDSRPLICRLYGATESLPCAHGCTPARVLSDDEAAALIDRVVHETGGVAR